MTTRERLTPHFVIEEFDCNDGTHVPQTHVQAYRYLCQVFLEPLRERFGPCTVHSGFRTPAWNLKVGGARLSFHVVTLRRRRDGVAADVEFARGSVAQWLTEAQIIRQASRKGNGGLGYYPRGGFIHVDTRDYPANWDGP